MEEERYEKGSELHRVKEFTQYDPQQFNRLFKKVRPLITRLVYNIDNKRLNVTKDVIESYFHDKFMYVYMRYHDEYDEDKLLSTLIKSLSIFKNKLLRQAYTEDAEINQSMSKLEDLFDNNKEDLGNYDEDKIRRDQIELVWEYMKKHLSSDAFLIFEVIMDPPPYFSDKTKEGVTKVTNIGIVDFFELPRTRKSLTYIAEVKKDIDYYAEKARSVLPQLLEIY